MIKYTFTFKLLIGLDHLLNVLLLGNIATTLSSRAYIQAQLLGNTKWVKWEKCINWIMREERHCLESFAWEVNRNKEWVAYYRRVINGNEKF
jgi:hypothetical protein